MIRRVRVLDAGQQVNESNSHVITMNINVGDKFTLRYDNAYNCQEKTGTVFMLHSFDEDNEPMFVKVNEDGSIDDSIKLYLDIEVLNPIIELKDGDIAVFVTGHYGIVANGFMYECEDGKVTTTSLDMWTPNNFYCTDGNIINISKKIVKIIRLSKNNHFQYDVNHPNSDDVIWERR